MRTPTCVAACLVVLAASLLPVCRPAVYAAGRDAGRKTLTLGAFRQRLRVRLQNARSLSGEVSGNAFELMRPGRYHLRGSNTEVWCDGKMRVRWEHGKEVSTGPATPDGRADDLRPLVGLEPFFEAGWEPYHPVGPNRSRYEGRDCYWIEFKYGESPMFWTRLYVDARAWLPVGWVDYEMGEVNGGGVYRGLVVNPRLPVSRFRPPSSSGPDRR